jgi:hypothetical protein
LLYGRWKKKYYASFSLIIEILLLFFFSLNRNLIQRQALLLLVVVSDLVKRSIKISNAMPNIIYVAMKTYATIKRLVFVLNQNSSTDQKRLNYRCARAVCLCEQFLFASFSFFHNK